jgi:hypothetical protein
MMIRPLIYVDVNIAPGRSERISVYAHDTPEALAWEFAMRHQLDGAMRLKLERLLEGQIAQLR